MRANNIKQKWANKEAVLGVISNSSDPTIAELCGWSGLDFYMIDSEHSPVTTSEVQTLFVLVNRQEQFLWHGFVPTTLN